MSGTAWSFVNAVGQYMDHEYTANKSGDKRFENIINGTASNIKQKALNLALAQ